MPPTPSLTGSLERTYAAIFRHPAAEYLEWSAVHELFRHLGEITAEPNGNVRVSRNGETLRLELPLTQFVTEEEDFLALRRFLERSETVPPSPTSPWVLLIDHHEARLFRSESKGTLPQVIFPPSPDRYYRHTQDSANQSRGKEKPDPNSFFEPIARALQDARSLLLFGTGTGNSNEMDQFLSWLRIHHADLAGRIVGTVVVNASHLTEGQLLRMARAFVGHPPAVVQS